MNLKPLYRSNGLLLVGLTRDFKELCVLDGLVVELDLDRREVIGEPESGLKKLKSGSYLPIRQDEKREFTRLIEKRLKRRVIRKIEENLESPPVRSIESLTWVPERLGGSESLQF